MRERYRELDREELDAILTYAETHGRTWKSQLNDAWQRAAEPGVLQAIRNSHGPHWLVGFKLPRETQAEAHERFSRNWEETKRMAREAVSK